MGLEYNPQSGDIPCFPLGFKNILNEIFLMFQNGKKGMAAYGSFYNWLRKLLNSSP